MFALIRTEPCGPERPADRILSLIRPSFGVRAEAVDMLDIRVTEYIISMPCTMTGKRKMKRAETAIAALFASGARTVISAESFEFVHAFTRFPLRPPDRLGLLRKAAGKLALFAMGNDAPRKTAALYTARLTSDFDETVRYLLPRTRNLAIRCGIKRDAYTSGLLAEYGVSVLTNRIAFDAADIHIFFDAPSEPVSPRSGSTALCLCRESIQLGCRMVRDAEFEWPERLGKLRGYPREELITALFEAGALNGRELDIKRLI